MVAILGIVAFVLALFVVGSLMEREIRRAGIYGVALLICTVVIMSFDDRRSIIQTANCWTEWDMRVSRTVCD